MPPERLQKLLARSGYGSRRSAERLIAAGRVTVDGRVATLGERADPEQHRIAVDGRPLPPPIRPLTLMLNKPEGYLVTAADERGRPTVYDLLTSAPPGLRYVGRLDRDSSGLLLLTTDGELAFRLSHPRYRVAKRYLVEVDGVPAAAALTRLRQGVKLDDGMTAPAEVVLLDSGGGHSRLRITIYEGRKRQLRRMLQAVGQRVRRLTRTDVGDVELGSLAAGASRPLTEEEERTLRDLVGLLDASQEASI